MKIPCPVLGESSLICDFRAITISFDGLGRGCQTRRQEKWNSQVFTMEYLEQTLNSSLLHAWVLENNIHALMQNRYCFSTSVHARHEMYWRLKVWFGPIYSGENVLHVLSACGTRDDDGWEASISPAANAQPTHGHLQEFNAAPFLWGVRIFHLKIWSLTSLNISLLTTIDERFGWLERFPSSHEDMAMVPHLGAWIY